MRKFFSLLFLSILFLYLNLTPVVRFEREQFGVLTTPPSKFFSDIYKKGLDIIEVSSKVSLYKNENNSLKEIIAKKDLEIIRLNELIKDSNFYNEQKSYSLNYKFIDAKLIGTKEIAGDNLLIVDKGLEQGVEEKNTVIYKGYLVGNISSTENSSSVVKTLNSSNIEVPAESLNNNTVGIYTCVDYTCYFDKVLTGSELKEGDTIITSGVTDDFKRGYIIGKVQKIESSPEQPFKKATLSKEINLNAISKMAIILNEK